MYFMTFFYCPFLSTTFGWFNMLYFLFFFIKFSCSFCFTVLSFNCLQSVFSKHPFHKERFLLFIPCVTYFGQQFWLVGNAARKEGKTNFLFNTRSPNMGRNIGHIRKSLSMANAWLVELFSSMWQIHSELTKCCSNTIQTVVQRYTMA